MNPTDTARQLLALLGAPRGAVSILPEPEPKTGFALRVWVNPSFCLDDIPSEFLGHPVIVQDSPRFLANH
jgi:hypothetical protein